MIETYIGLLDVLDAVGVDAEFWTEHALVPLHEIELAQVGFGAISVVDFGLYEVNGTEVS